MTRWLVQTRLALDPSATWVTLSSHRTRFYADRERAHLAMQHSHDAVFRTVRASEAGTLPAWARQAFNIKASGNP